MAIAVDGYPYRTFKEQLQSIPLPKLYWTDKEWRSGIVSELRPYFILTKADYATFLIWINDELGIREMTSRDLKDQDLKYMIHSIRKGVADNFWLLEKNENSELFYETEPWAEGVEERRIVIGYNEDLDEFYSNSNFLDHVLAYFRGINEEDLSKDSLLIYPIRTPLAYANNLHCVLEQYSGYRGLQIIHRILHAETLAVSAQKGQKTTVSGEVFLPVFQQTFDEYDMDTHFPE